MSTNNLKRLDLDDAWDFVKTGELSALRELAAIALYGNEEPPYIWDKCLAEARRLPNVNIHPNAVWLGLCKLGYASRFVRDRLDPRHLEVSFGVVADKPPLDSALTRP